MMVGIPLNIEPVHAVWSFGCALFPGLSLLRPAVKILCWICAAVTVISGLTYFSGSEDLFSDMK